MIRLPYTGTYSLELITAQNGANVVVCYSDATGTAYTGGTQATAITSATTTAICATPAAATVRDIDEINIKNTYAGSHTLTVQLDANGTNHPIITVALAEDESLNYTHGSGWQCKDANGNTKITPTAVTPKSWKLNTYTAATWTDLVAGTAAGESVKAVNIANLNVGTANVSIRVATSGGTSEATILPTTAFATGTAQQLDVDCLNLTASQKLQIYGDVTGVEFYASGVTYA